MSFFSVDVMTPYGVLGKDIPTESLFAPTVYGQINILPDHTHLISKLDTGILICKSSSGEERKFVVTTGIIKVLKKKITVLAQVAEKADEIDFDRARKALALAHDKINSDEILDDEQLTKFRRKLLRALVRIELVKK